MDGGYLAGKTWNLGGRLRYNTLLNKRCTESSGKGCIKWILESIAGVLIAFDIPCYHGGDQLKKVGHGVVAGTRIDERYSIDLIVAVANVDHFFGQGGHVNRIADPIVGICVAPQGLIKQHTLLPARITLSGVVMMFANLDSTRQ